MSTEKINLDIHKILTLLPHRYPILLVTGGSNSSRTRASKR